MAFAALVDSWVVDPQTIDKHGATWNNKGGLLPHFHAYDAMSTAHRFQSISVEDYLEGELTAEVRHEYIAGEVYAMVGGRLTHNRIALNTAVSLSNQLRGNRCQPCGSDTKIKVERDTGTYFYYPDASVVCESNPGSSVYQDKPVVIVEVLSESTRRFDLGEKKDAYLTIPSLALYILLEQDAIAAMVFRRDGDAFVCEKYTNAEDRIPLKPIAAELHLAEIYANVFDEPAK